MPHMRPHLVLAAALVALCRPAAAASCAAGSPTWCFYGSSYGANYSNTWVDSPVLNPYSFVGMAPFPQTSGNCSCVSYLSSYASPPSVLYSMVGPSELAVIQSDEGLSQLYVCNSNFCNCNATACTAKNPLAAGGACSATPSAGPLQCREGEVGTMQTEDGPSLALTAATPGNLASSTYPAGSMCYSYVSLNDDGSSFTTYTGVNVSECVRNAAAAASFGDFMVNATSCGSDNCGAPAPTGPQCPAAAAANATSCYTGLTGPTAALALLGPMLSLNAPYTPSNQAGGPTCVSATASCAALLAIPGSGLTASTCPSGSSVSMYTSAAAVSSGEDDGSFSCNQLLRVLSMLNTTSLLGCGSSNCNSPTAAAYVAATATLNGYTVATFGTAEAAQFSRAVATSLGVAASAVTVTGVSAAPAAGRHLLSGGVVVAFTVATTVSGTAALNTALAAPLSAATFQAAGLTQVTAVTAAPAAASATPPTPLQAASLPQTGSGAAPSAAPAARGAAAAAVVAFAVAIMAV